MHSIARIGNCTLPDLPLVNKADLWRYIMARDEKGATMELLKWILIGLLAGVVARLVVPGREPGGCAVTILLGIAGALLAGYVGRLAGFYRVDGRAGLLSAILGSVAIITIYRFLIRRI